MMALKGPQGNRRSQVLAECRVLPLPSSRLQHVRFVDPKHCETLHRTLQIFADFQQNLEIVEMRRHFHNRPRPLLRFSREPF